MIFDNLLFLVPSMETSETSGNIIPYNDADRDDDIDSDDDVSEEGKTRKRPYGSLKNMAQARATIKTLKDVNLLMSKCEIDMKETAQNLTRISSECAAKYAKTPDRRDVIKSILSIMMVERMKEQMIGKVCERYSEPEMWVDPLTSGMWVVNPSDSHPAIAAARTRKVISTYELDDAQTQSLVSLAFSTKPRETAAAKLNLFSRVRGHNRESIRQNPRLALAVVLSETDMTG